MNKKKEALELLKMSRETGESLLKTYKAAKNEDIYEEMDEDDYQNIVKHRQKADSFVVDDDGCGYADDGLEVWDRNDEEQYEEMDGEFCGEKDKKPSKKKKYSREIDNSGNKNISELFHKAINQKASSTTKDRDNGKDFLNSLFESDNTEGICLKGKKVRPAQRMSTKVTEMRADKRDVESIFDMKPSEQFLHVESNQKVTENENPPIERELIENNDPQSYSHEKSAEEFSEEYFSPDDLAEVEKIETDQVHVKKKEDAPIPIEFLKAIQLEDDISSVSIDENPIEIESSSESILKFYWIDLQEKPNSSSLFLIGKLYNEQNKKLSKCCISVNAIEKSIYFLPEVNAEPDELFSEIDNLMHHNKITKFTKKIVSRKYAFEIPNIPLEADYVKVSFLYGQPVNISSSGKYYSHVFGLSSSLTESFIIKRKIMGPCWLSIKQFSMKEQKISWSSIELDIPCKNIQISLENNPEEPLLDAVAIDCKTVINQRTKTHEIVAANLLFFKGINSSQTTSTHPCCKSIKLIRHLDGVALPVRFQEHFHNKGFGRVDLVKSEKILLNKLCSMLNFLDPDIIIGHNILNFDLEIILSRIKECKCEEWPKLGRIKFSQLPKGSNSSEFALKQIFNGRLICDTYLASKELVKSKLYSLEALSHLELNTVRPPLDDERIVEYYSSFDSLCYLINHNENDSLLSAQLAFKIGIIPLSKQLTILAGNLWWRTLNGARAERNEYLLLHEFHNAKYIVPEKKSFRNHSSNDEEAEESAPNSKRKAAYLGGLVLEPKKGLYDKIILLLDFNSLYPSIIQEYNICFTTIERSLHHFSDDNLPTLPDKSFATGILPKLLANLVARRRQVKNLMKDSTLTPSQWHELEIRQKALKLTANSMYGCLGFVHSRFYAKELAMLITSKGREILQNTVEIAQQKCNLDVIYGDTDSVMINTGCNSLVDAKKMGTELKKAVNERYRLVEIEIDGIFTRLLLLKKKKYAALVFDEKSKQNTLEMKGLDLVRRDWSYLSVDCSEWVLEQIMRLDVGKEETVEKIHEYLEQVGNAVRAGHIELDKFVINKNLTKAPEEYADKLSQPHVQVALRMIQRGIVVKPGDIVPYVICKGKESGSLLAQNAFHPDELKKDSSLQLDYEWYLCQQVHPPIARLCQYIQGTDSARLASCLGLDYSKYHTKYDDEMDESKKSFNSIPSYISYFENNNDFKPKFQIEYHCCSCNQINEIAPGWNKTCFNCQKAPLLSTVYMGIICYAKQIQKAYYANTVVCDDRLCGYSSYIFNLANSGMNCPGCQGSLQVSFGEKDCYFHLKYLYELMASFGDESGMIIAKKIDSLIDDISFRTVQLNKLFTMFTI